ncbi:MAG: hypothetical protein HYY44_09665, partial [Deltaproteobacteria bacterium]|nr:hypothetical protein [Deltaproteobacteria bacterium]
AWRAAQGGFLRPVQFGRFEESCTDQRDNNGDGWYDCFDADCFYAQECPSVTQDECMDRNGNGVIEGDWEDLVLAPAGEKRLQAVCAQLYDADNSATPDTEGRAFLVWMRRYSGRVINLHARQMREGYRRNSTEHTSFQYYFNLRRNLPYWPAGTNVPAATLSFKSNGPFQIVFHEVRATDSWIRNEPVPVSGLDSLGESIFQTYFRSVEFSHQIHEVSYESTFGFSPCAGYSDPCLTGVRSFVGQLRDPSTMNLFYLAGRSTDSSRPFAVRDYLGAGSGPESAVFQIPPGERTVLYNHEMGHFLPLPHPLASVAQGNLNENVRNILGTTSVMSALGYIYTSVNHIGPLEAYALEPIDGFDQTDFGRIYSEAVLGTTP